MNMEILFQILGLITNLSLYLLLIIDNRPWGNVNPFRLVGINHCRPYKATPDGNCLYNSIGLACFGTEIYSYELRVRTAIKHREMGQYLCSTEFMSKIYSKTNSKKDIEIILVSSVQVDDLDMSDHQTSIESMSRRVLESSVYSSILEILAVGHVLNVNLNILYPCDKNPFTKKELFSGEFKCCKSEAGTSDSLISLTHTYSRDIQSGRWIPNHFVPCEVSMMSQ